VSATTPAVAHPTPAGERTLTGTGTLVRFAMRRDRLRLPVWVLAVAATLIGLAASFPGLYPDADAHAARATIVQSPAGVAFSGPRIGVSDYTFGAMLTNEMLGLAAVVVALMSIFTVVRHTRANEEAGHTELVRAGVVGRHAPLGAALAVTVAADLAVGAVTALGLDALGLESIDWRGSLLYGAALAGVGVVFAGVAALTAQVADHARSASGLAGLVLGVSYGLRAAGDVTGRQFAWLSPIAWAQRTYAFVENRWWPLALMVVVGVGLCAVAAALSTRRDFGAGLGHARPGRATASTALASPLGLPLRLHRTALIAWALSFLGFGLVYGSLMGDVSDFADRMGAIDPVFAGLGGEDLMVNFVSLLSMMLAMTAAIFAVVTASRPRSEEAAGHAETLLALPLGRTRWVGGHAAVAAAGSVVILFAGAAGMGISGAATAGDTRVLTWVLEGSAVQVAPLLLVVGITVALYGVAPRAMPLVWVVVGYALFAGTFGGLLRLPQWTMDVSPFAVVPRLPAQAFDAVPVLAVVAVATAALAAGLWGLCRRDMRTGG